MSIMSAKLGRPEQGLLAILPVVGFQALGRLEPALVDQALAAEFLECPLDRTGIDQRALGGIDVDGDAQRGEVGLDFGHQGRHGERPHLGQPVGLRLVDPARAIALRDGRADLLQVLAGIKALGNRVDALA
jgi:hypothetical protein